MMLSSESGFFNALVADVGRVVCACDRVLDVLTRRMLRSSKKSAKAIIGKALSDEP